MIEKNWLKRKASYKKEQIQEKEVEKLSQKGIKEEKGAATLFVLVSMLFFILMASAIYTSTSNKKTAIVEDTYNIESEYYISNSSVQQAYEAETAIPIEGWNEEEEVNSPVIEDGMIPIKWDSTNSTWVICEETDANWYQYENQTTVGGTASMWANMMLSDGEYDTDTAVGTAVALADLGSMFVWIPRYSYSITTLYHTSSTSGGVIEIKFLKGTTNVAADGQSTWNTSRGQGNWDIHPAFTLGDDELTGIWVAKFEASKNTTDTTQIAIKPNVTSWRDITIGDSFDKSLAMNSSGNIYEITESTDTHMMLNSEWGAVAYLTQSSYGRNCVEVTINDNSSYYTGDANYISNVAQSTTGNVTGIYDMSGGTWERIASYVDNGDSALTTNGQSLVDNMDTKYVEVYSMGITDTQVNNYSVISSIYGDAIWETSSSYTGYTSWYSDYSYCPYSSGPFFVRGGGYSNGSSTGLFNFNFTDGYAGSGSGFRTVLASVSAL